MNTVELEQAKEPLFSLVARLPGAFRRSMAPGEVMNTSMFREESCVVVESGGIAIMDRHPRRGGKTLEVVGPSGCIAPSPPAQGLSAPEYELVALTPVKVLAVPAQTYQARVLEDHEFAMAESAARREQHSSLLNRLAILRTDDPLKQLAGALLQLADLVGRNCEHRDRLHFSLTQDLLASIAGLSRQTTNRTLRLLKSKRLVNVERAFVCIMDPKGLESAVSGFLPESCCDEPISCKLRHPNAATNCTCDNGTAA